MRIDDVRVDATDTSVVRGPEEPPEAAAERGHDHPALQPARRSREVRRIRPHDVRRTHATLSLDSGVHAKIVSDRIGHAHEGITVSIYGHRSTGHDREAAELVAGLIRSRLDGGATGGE